jgi:hypothetical protein
MIKLLWSVLWLKAAFTYQCVHDTPAINNKNMDQMVLHLFSNIGFASKAACLKATMCLGDVHCAPQYKDKKN